MRPDTAPRYRVEFDRSRPAPRMLALTYLATALCAFAATAGRGYALPEIPEPETRNEVTAKKPAASEAAVSAVKLALDGKHAKAAERKADLKDAAAKTLIDWLRVRSSNSGASFDEIAQFMKSHSDWPQMGLIRARAETALYTTPASPEKVIAHFKAYPASTGLGLIAHARALQSTGKKETALELVRTAWREHNFGAATERSLRKEFKSHLTGQDHRARLVRLLYFRRTKDALRTAGYISSAHVTMVKAASALFARNRRALRRYNAVPAKLRNQLVMQYALARYYRRKGKSELARDIVLKIPASPSELSYPKPWWDERWALIRTTLKKDTRKDWPLAYKMASAHGFDSGTSFVQGEFMSGWIALQFLKKPEVARGHFERILERDEKPLNLAQAHYWLGRTHLALKGKEKAEEHFKKAAGFSTTFYGQLALDQLGLGEAPIPIVNGPNVSDDAALKFSRNSMVGAIRLLDAAGSRRHLPTFFGTLTYRLETAEERVALAKLAVDLGEIWLSVRVAKVSGRNGVKLEQFAYPKDALPKAEIEEPLTERALVYAISRQESEFNPRAISHAGAMGLMQMMPGTARQVTKQIGMKYRKSALIDKPSYNVTLGTVFLGDLLKRFNGSYISTIAGYNAGPGRVNEWNRRYGDPHKGEIEPVDWIESIPFNETRNYVKRVLENVQVYRTLFGDQPLVPLSFDLHRGREKRADAAETTN